jgi:transposase
MERLEMSKVREILRLRLVQRHSVRETARATSCSTGVVAKIEKRAQLAGLTPEAVEALSDDVLERRLYGGPKFSQGPGRVRPDPVWISLQLRRPGVTLELLHLEYLAEHPDGYRYTAFCDHFRAWQKKAQVTLRQPHKAGERAFVDYSGKRPHIIDPETGEKREVELFVGCLGASNYTYVEATLTQQLADFVGAHTRMFEFFGGVPRMTVPDQLRSAVQKPGRYEPTINRTYAELGRHYGTAIVPARPRKPRDKSKVEVAVLVAQRWILARLRNERFHSLDALNARIAELRDALNRRPMRQMGDRSRRDLFEILDRPMLRALPADRFVISQWKWAKVAPDYHVAVDDNYYSVPYTLVGERVEICLTPTMVEVIHRGERVAVHPRSPSKYRHATDTKHMPEAHRAFFEGGQAVQAWAAQVGPWTAKMVEQIFAAHPIEIQGWRSAKGLQRLERIYGAERLERGCERAVGCGARSYKPVERMLRLGREQVADDVAKIPPVEHENLRGPQYFN